MPTQACYKTDAQLTLIEREKVTFSRQRDTEVYGIVDVTVTAERSTQYNRCSPRCFYLLFKIL